MRFTIPALVLAAALAGCDYSPLAYEDNVPQLSDAVVDREMVVFGDATFDYSDDNDNFVCTLVMDFQGWVEEVDPEEVGCFGCTENYTLAYTVDDGDSTCNHSIPGAATIAITPTSYFDRDANPEWIWDNFLMGDPPEEADGQALGFLQTNWDPRGPNDTWSPRLAIWNAAEDSGLGFAREYYALGFYRWGTNAVSEDGFARWRMNIQVAE